MKIFKKDFLKNIKILIVEDDPYSYDLVKHILKTYEVKIEWAHNGQQAVDFIRNNPDIGNCIILMDIKMPTLDGFEANRQIKKINDKLPVIALTAYAKAGDKEKILSENFDDYISKPIKIESLLSLLSKFSEKIK